MQMWAPLCVGVWNDGRDIFQKYASDVPSEVLVVYSRICRQPQVPFLFLQIQGNGLFHLLPVHICVFKSGPPSFGYRLPNEIDLFQRALQQLCGRPVVVRGVNEGGVQLHSSSEGVLHNIAGGFISFSIRANH